MPALKRKRPDVDTDASHPGPDADTHPAPDPAPVPAAAAAAAAAAADHRTSKLPTASELRVINESHNLFKSNTFRFKLEALLPKIRPRQSYIPPLERSLQTLYTYLTSLPSIQPIHPLHAQDSLNVFGTPRSPLTIPYPSPSPAASTSWKLAFDPPASISLVGSWPDALAVRNLDSAFFTVDLAVQIPATLFQEKDYKNSRVFHKRAFFLACLAAALLSSSSPLQCDVMYDAVEGDLRRTCLLLSSQKDGSEFDFSKLRAVIRIIPLIPDDAPIPSRRLSPSHSNIKPAPAEPDANDRPTPLYNNTLALSHARPSRARLLGAHRLAGIAASFKDALALLRVWANQRGFVAGPASTNPAAPRKMCVRGFEGLGAWWPCVMEVVVLGEQDKKGHVLGKGMSSYQLFRAALDFLAKREWESEVVVMKRVEHAQKFDPAEWKKHHDVVWIDPSGMVNMLAGVDVGALQLLSYDAKTTLHTLNSQQDPDPFAKVFMSDMRELHARFDAVVRVNLASLRLFAPTPTNTLDFPSVQTFTIHLLLRIVRKALNTRARVVAPLQWLSSPLRVDSTAAAVPTTTLVVGIIFDPAHAMRLVDHGPPPSAKEHEGGGGGEEEEAFRAFWGPAKAELRRFKDGRILQSCVWDEDVLGGGGGGVEEREAVPGRIVRYILQRHFGGDGVDVDVVVVHADCAALVRGARGAQPEGGFKPAMAAYEKLVRELRMLEEEGDVPLAVVAVKPCSPGLRYTAVFPPYPVQQQQQHSHAHAHGPDVLLAPFDVVVQLERSPQWPDDLRAIQKVKLALLEGMARGFLRRNHDHDHDHDAHSHDKKNRNKNKDKDRTRNANVNRACVVLDEGASEVQDGCAMEVVLDGWAFHVRVALEREEKLLEDVVEGSSRTATSSTAATNPATRTNSATRTNPATTGPIDRHTAERALLTWRRRFIHAPAHHSAMLALSHKLGPAFAYTVRLVKRWMAAHWVGGARVREEAVELVCAAVFLEGVGGAGEGVVGVDVPATGKRGFVRVVRWLKEWSGAVYVPVYEAVREEQQAGGGGGVGEEVKGGGGVQAGKGRWRLMTAQDKTGTVWVDDVPGVVAARVRALADATLRCLEAEGEGPRSVLGSFKALFDHPTADYDFIIELDPRVVPRYGEQRHNTASAPGYTLIADTIPDDEDDDDENLLFPRVGFNPAEHFFRDLHAMYGDIMELFYDVYGGTRIGGVWNPAVAGSSSSSEPHLHPWKVFLGFSSLPVPVESGQTQKGRPSVRCNTEGVLAEIERMGEGLVTKITVR